MKKMFFCLLLGLTGTAFGADPEIKSPWVRSTVEGQPATGAFMDISSTTGITVLSVSSPVAGIAEVHEMKMDEGVMKMRAVRQLAVSAGQTVQLAPGSYHIMLMSLKSTLKPGSVVPITITYQDKTGKKHKVEVKAEVRDMTATATMPASHEKMHEAMHEHMNKGQ